MQSSRRRSNFLTQCIQIRRYYRIHQSLSHDTGGEELGGILPLS